MRKATEKIVSREKLLSLLAAAKQRGQRIVLANGVFDTIHVGHARYLAAAKAEGDLLVVAVNSDSGVRALKGPGRPILDEQARALLVAAVRTVDYVVIFSELNVEKLLEELCPDVHAKATHYTADSVPERAVAARLAIRVAIVRDPTDPSTRSLLDAIRKPPHV